MKAGTYLEIGLLDELGRLDTPLHRLDARTKILTTVLFIVTVMSFSRYQVSALIPLFLFPLVLTGAGHIPPGSILKRTAIALPFALFVGLFNPLIDRQIMFSAGSVEISGGWLSFASILIRFCLTVSVALILVSCTGINRLCAGLERMGVPNLFAVQLLFLYRYLFVVGDELMRMVRSVRMRSAGSKRPDLHTYGALTGHLLLRSMDRAQRIHRAMVSRGFTGEVHVLHRTRPGLEDAAFLLGWSIFFVIVRFLNPMAGIGRWLTGILQ